MEVGVHVFPAPLGRFVDLVHDAEMWVPGSVSRSIHVMKANTFVVHCPQVTLSVDSPAHIWLPICSQGSKWKQMLDLTF